MKRLPALITLLCISIGFAQTQNTDQEVDIVSATTVEFKANIIYAAFGVAEASLEVSLCGKAAIGVTGTLPFADRPKDNIEYLITPYYRHYFGSTNTTGFFLEGFGIINSVDREFQSSVDDKYITDLALGGALGYKWLTNQGLVLGINFGLGVNLLNTDKHEYGVISKGGINLGYRF